MMIAISSLLYLHVVALHCSIAGMEIVSSLIAAVTLLGVLARQIKWSPREVDLRVFVLLAVFTAWVGVSLLVNPPVKAFWFQFGFMRWTLILVALTVALEAVWSDKFERTLILVWSYATILTGAYAIFQCVTGIDLIRSGAVFAQGGGIYKATGFFSISLTYAYVFGIMTFAVFKPALEVSRRLGAAVILVGAGGILASMSRGAWLAGIAGVFVYLLAKQRRFVLPALVLLGVAGGLLIYQGGGFATKITQMAELHVDHSSSMRLDLWRAYTQMFFDHPFFGVGIFAGDKYLPGYYAQLHIVQEFTSHAHNNLLQFLAGTGVFGLFLYMITCGWFLRWAWRLRDQSAWGWSLFLAQVFLQLGGLTECNFIDGEVTHALVFTWALTWMLDRLTKSPKAACTSLS